MSLNPGGATNYNWNYSNEARDGFSLELTGTVVSLQEVQARDWDPITKRPGKPKVWPDGNPVMNIRVGFATPDGALKSTTFMKAGKKQISGEKPSLHMQLYGLTDGNMTDLIGKTVHLWTWPCHPESGQQWGLNNPRLFGVEEIPDVKYELAASLPDEFKVPELLCNDGAQGGQPVPPAPQQMYQPNVMPMQGMMYAAPTAPMQYQQHQPQYPYTQQQPAQFQPNMPAQAPQPMPQPMPQQQYQPMQQQMPAVQAMPPQAAPMPQGMDPAVAAAMQSVGAVNVQPVIYDDLPF